MTRLIDADELREFLNHTTCKAPYSKEQVLMWIDMARPVDAVPVRHGEWIDRNGAMVAPFWERYECSVCGARSDKSNYCPNCGARMDK